MYDGRGNEVHQVIHETEIHQVIHETHVYMQENSSLTVMVRHNPSKKKTHVHLELGRTKSD